MCGIAGFWNIPNPLENLFVAMKMLQHRGEEAAGIALYDGRNFLHKRRLGKLYELENVFREIRASEFGDACLSGIGHLRYPTSGAPISIANAQPLRATCCQGDVFAAHNGNIPDFKNARDAAQKDILSCGNSDTRLILRLISESQADKIEFSIADALKTLKGAFSLVFLCKDKLIAARDPWGFKPLSLAAINGGYVIASETCAFDPLKAKYLRDIEPGEILTIDKNGLNSFIFARSEKKLSCIFELIYFSRPDSRAFEAKVWEFRERLGEELASIYGDCKGEVFASLPDSGNFIARGFAKTLGIVLEEIFVRNHYEGRSFISPDQKRREEIVKIKINVIKEKVAGKAVVIFDDSIVRGNTIRKIIRMLRLAGASKVVILIGSPPIRGPCYYGIDMKTHEELIAYKKEIDEVRKFIEADFLGYLSLESLRKIGSQYLNKGFCDGCFSGNYLMS